MTTKPRTGINQPDEVSDDPSWLSRIGGPTFVIMIAALVLLGLQGGGVLPKLESAQVGIIVTVFVGGEKTAKTMGRFVSGRRY